MKNPDVRHHHVCNALMYPPERPIQLPFKSYVPKPLTTHRAFSTTYPSLQIRNL